MVPPDPDPVEAPTIASMFPPTASPSPAIIIASPEIPEELAPVLNEMLPPAAEPEVAPA
jgi:hypothetical protein